MIIQLDSFVPGGQVIGTLPEGKKIFVWGGLPGETVEVAVTRNKRDFAEGYVQQVIEASPKRIEPKQQEYLSTSPWQVLDYKYETEQKKYIVQQAAQQHGVKLPNFDVVNDIDEHNSYGYRNKMEYSFFGDDDGLHLALHRRGSHHKIIVQGSALANSRLDIVAHDIAKQLELAGIRGAQLKTLIVRSNLAGDVIAAVFIKEKLDIDLTLGTAKGIAVYFSNPKSPASVPTELLSVKGDPTLTELINGYPVSYGPVSFFQVNIPVFNQTMEQIKAFVGTAPILDMYGGVGTISAGLGQTNSTVVELDSQAIEFACGNVPGGQVIQASSEKALEHIVKDKVTIVDPPRAGLHKDVIDKILQVCPEKLVYLSCNPATQMRDLKLLEDVYTIKQFFVYNYFPRTPHIESLALVTKI